MVKWIAHRGNVDGPDETRENHPNYIAIALSEGFDVEIDVWRIVDECWLGHDEPQYRLDNNTLLMTKGVWCHAKNDGALQYLLNIGAVCFWHETDAHTLTSNGHAWTYPSTPLRSCGPLTIDVMPEMAFGGDSSKTLTNSHKTRRWIGISGVCTDYPRMFKESSKDQEIVTPK